MFILLYCDYSSVLKKSIAIKTMVINKVVTYASWVTNDLLNQDPPLIIRGLLLGVNLKGGHMSYIQQGRGKL